jgi:hypothetical protein
MFTFLALLVAVAVFYLGVSEVVSELILANREADEEYRLNKLRGNTDPRDNNI